MAIGQPQPIQKLAVGQRLYNFGFTDSVLFTEAYMRPRYKGSKLIGAKINEYTDYTQLTADKFGLRNRFLDQDRLGYINTTKTIDGTFPYPLTFERDTTVDANIFFRADLRGNKIFPNPAFNSERDLLNQNGTIPPGNNDILEIVNGILSFESQYAGGYLRDRSYGRNPVIEVKTNTIYEFDWGGSTYPEVEKGGSVHIKQILNVDSYTKGNPNVYIVNEATNDSFRVDTSTIDGQGVSTLTDNPGEETDFSLNFKRSLASGDRITLNSYIAGTPTVDGPESVVGSINDLVNEVNAVPTKNVVTLEPGLGVPSYGGIYIQRGLGGNNNITSSVTGEPIGIPFLPRFESGERHYVGPSVTTNPYADFYYPDFYNPGGPDVLASTLRNVKGSYYVPTTGSGTKGTVYAGDNPRIYKRTTDEWSYLKVDPEGFYRSGSDVSEANIGIELSSSLALGNRHFVSFYNSLGTKAKGELNQIGEPVEIKSISKGALKVDIFFKDQPPITGSIGLGDIGILVWKAQQGPFAVMKPTDIAADYSYRFLKTGGFYREYSTNTIKQHFDNIVKTVGMKPSL
tara:strand:- start:4311 stop:6020 length:1710 start_codon:yes stop_codon:yes gene_type:complete